MSEKTIIATMELSADEWFTFMAWKKKINPASIQYKTSHNGEPSNVFITILDEAETIKELVKLNEGHETEIYNLLSDQKYYDSRKYVQDRKIK